MRVAACQTPDLREDLPGAVELIRSRAEQAHAAAADVILFPECFLQGYFTDPTNVERLAIGFDELAFAPVRQLSSQIDITFVIGLIERSPEGCHNSTAVLRGGELIACYRKRYLLQGESEAFQAGDDCPVVEVADRRVGFNICYDLQFSEAAALAATRDAEVLLCPCNNMLSRANAEAFKDQHNAIRAERCREAGLWLVSADVTGERDGRISYGPTAVLDPAGKTVEQLPLLTEGMLIADI